ncbi:dehydration-responsive element-binding protein 1B [Daucus carota subsp. sativus]|uniref:dehydration-responsive element-binding protein 1B n=1 Tax=Daucus carota subsp. sativus TaxID=79200 RepID=UPI0030833503
MENYYTYSDQAQDPSPSPLDESSSTTESKDNCDGADSEYEVLLATSTPKKPSGRKKFRETRHPVYRGIRRRDSGKWVCEVREPINNSRIWLGTYPTAEMAARANDVAVIALRGRNACLNFADSAWRLPLPESSDVKHIQVAAAKAAEAFRPPKDENAAGTSTEQTPELQEDYIDEEAIFSMPELINSMAEGMMLPPPQCVQNDGDGDLEDATDLSLWNY